MKLLPAPLPEGPALIGVSGGRDSVALLHAVVEAGMRPVVCHLDHGLRLESRAEARFVGALASRLGCAFEVRREAVAARAKRTAQSVETAARDARYAFFARVARARGISRVLLAHHADDQVETLLFNLLRGSGATGLAAMRPVARRMEGKTELILERPLLGVWREHINAYIASHGLEYCEDASNAGPQAMRNRLRHEVIPMLSGVFGREVRGAIWRSAEILREEDAFLAGQPELEAAAGERLGVAAVRALPLALQRRLLAVWLRGRGLGEIGFEAVERVRSLLGGRVAKVNLPGARHARRRAGWLFVE